MNRYSVIDSKLQRENRAGMIIEPADAIAN